jgi:hypothetical protein
MVPAQVEWSQLVAEIDPGRPGAAPAAASVVPGAPRAQEGRSVE